MGTSLFLIDKFCIFYIHQFICKIFWILRSTQIFFWFLNLYRNQPKFLFYKMFGLSKHKNTQIFHLVLEFGTYSGHNIKQISGKSVCYPFNRVKLVVSYFDVWQTPNWNMNPFFSQLEMAKIYTNTWKFLACIMHVNNLLTKT